MSDPLIDKPPVARRPRPRFGYVSSVPVPLSVGADVVYVGNKLMHLQDVQLPDRGIITEGPQTAGELGIAQLPMDIVFWHVKFNNRKKMADCWTAEQSLTVCDD